MNKKVLALVTLAHLGLLAPVFAGKKRVEATEILATGAITAGSDVMSDPIVVMGTDDVVLRVEHDGLSLSETVNVTTMQQLDGVWRIVGLATMKTIGQRGAGGAASGEDYPVYFTPGARALKFEVGLDTGSANVTLTAGTRKEEVR